MLALNPIAACKVCAKPFRQSTSLHTICSKRCLLSIPVIESKKQKAEKRADKARREALKSRSDWIKETQADFNRWIRLRDAHLGCVSCGATTGKENAGHYLSTGARPELRFDEANVHKQCERCNTYLHGNLIAYRIELIRRIGIAEVERLEGPHEPQKWAIPKLKEMRDEYRNRAKALNKERAE